MHAPSVRTRRIVALSAGPLAIVVAGLLVWQGSNAAFTARTQNVGNNWATGSVTLSDDDSGAAMIVVTNAIPGQSGSRCLTVTSTSTVPGVVKAYMSRISTQGLEDYIKITSDSGTGGGFGSCTGFVADSDPVPSISLADAALVNYDYATGGSAWTITGTPGESRTFKISWSFDTTGLTQTQIDALQGKSVSADAVWELQSN